MVKEATVGGSLKECLKFMVKPWIMIFCKYASKNGVLRILYLILTTTKANMKYLDFDSVDEKQVTEIHCLFATSDSFAIGRFFDVWW